MRTAIRYLSDCRGGVALSFGLILPVLIMATGLAVDYGYPSRQQSRVQAIADAAAVNSAHELRVATTDYDQLHAVAQQTANAITGTRGRPATVKVEVNNGPLSVVMNVVQPTNKLFPDWSDGAVSASATAHVMGGIPICMLGPDDDKKKAAITLEVNARLTGDACAVYSNARSKESLLSRDGALLEAGFICTVGGFSGAVGNFSPEPLTDCPEGILDGNRRFILAK